MLSEVSPHSRDLRQFAWIRNECRPTLATGFSATVDDFERVVGQNGYLVDANLFGLIDQTLFNASAGYWRAFEGIGHQIRQHAVDDEPFWARIGVESIPGIRNQRGTSGSARGTAYFGDGGTSAWVSYHRHREGSLVKIDLEDVAGLDRNERWGLVQNCFPSFACHDPITPHRMYKDEVLLCVDQCEVRAERTGVENNTVIPTARFFSPTAREISNLLSIVGIAEHPTVLGKFLEYLCSGSCNENVVPSAFEYALIAERFPAMTYSLMLQVALGGDETDRLVPVAADGWYTTLSGLDSSCGPVRIEVAPGVLVDGEKEKGVPKIEVIFDAPPSRRLHRFSADLKRSFGFDLPRHLPLTEDWGAQTADGRRVEFAGFGAHFG